MNHAPGLINNSFENPPTLMHLKKHTLIALFLSFLFSYSSLAETSVETSEQLAKIASLGQLYGIALPCNYIQQTRRIKSSMVAALPKKRYLGMAFEEATNESFLEFYKTGAHCPEEAALAMQIDTGINALNAAFND